MTQRMNAGHSVSDKSGKKITFVRRGSTIRSPHGGKVYYFQLTCPHSIIHISWLGRVQSK